MNIIESIISSVSPKTAVPTHYGELVGRLEDAQNFKKLLKETIECKIYI